jgi:hypothetical protein
MQSVWDPAPAAAAPPLGHRGAHRKRRSATCGLLPCEPSPASVAPSRIARFISRRTDPTLATSLTPTVRRQYGVQRRARSCIRSGQPSETDGFTFDLDAWYWYFMLRNYLGIVSNHGLEVLFPENDYVRRCLTKLAYDQRPSRRICCWAAMHTLAAGEIQGQLDGGETDVALEILQASAHFLGPVLPSDIGPFLSR